jgi:hypothetical protein
VVNGGSPPRSGGLSREVAVLALVDIAPASRLWGWTRFATARFALRGTPGLRFLKVLGAGRDGSFSPFSPSPSVQGLFCVFDDDASAAAFVGEGGALQPWRRRSRECFSVRLRAFSSRGSWAGTRLAVAADAPSQGPVASLTRAAIRPSRMLRFWRMQPAAERDLAGSDGCLMSAGVGEAPLVRQMTFSVWRDVAAMDAYARGGAHLAAIRAAGEGGFFSESMFVRFVPYEARGTWLGRTLAC